MVGIVIIFMYGFGTFLAYVIGVPLIRLILGKEGFKRATEQAMERKYGLTPEQKAVLDNAHKNVELIAQNIESTKKYREENERKTREMHQKIMEDLERRKAEKEARKKAEQEADKAKTNN